MDQGTPVWAAVGVGALLLAVGGLVPYVTVRAASGGLARNGWVGVRTPGTMSSDAGWRAGHAAARRWAAASGTVFAVGGLAALLVGALGGPGAVLVAAVVGAGVLGAVLLALGAARADAAGRASSRQR